MTQRSVAHAMDWSLSKVIRIEAGSVGVAVNDVRGLLNLYGVPEGDRLAALLETARAARQPSLWSAYQDRISAEFFYYLGHESSASVIRGYQPLVVPGLLQTADYARAVLQVFASNHDDDRLEEMIELRLRRQEILEGEDRPDIHFLLDESVIRRVAGTPAVMRRQLEHLLELSTADRINILIVPSTSGLYRLMTRPSALLEFDDLVDARILHLELPEGDKLIREDDPDIRSLGLPHGYLEEFWELENIALDQSTGGLIEDALDGLSRA